MNFNFIYLFKFQKIENKSMKQSFIHVMKTIYKVDKHLISCSYKTFKWNDKNIQINYLKMEDSFFVISLTHCDKLKTKIN